MKIKPYNFPLLIILAGIFFSLYLQFQVPEGVFYSGDAGLKALLAKQLSFGQLRFDLAPPPESWVQNLWNNALYPFEEPFVYNFANRYYITFPYTFPLVTAPFYALFGYRGFYIIPLISTWAIWVSFYWACQRLKFNKTKTAIALAILIFASPLTLYSATYWEHTLSVALAFQGIAMLLIPGKSQGLTIKNAAISGILIGLSVWFRPEFLCLVGILLVLVYFASLAKVSQLDVLTKNLNLTKLSCLTKNREIFVASMLITVGLFFLSNQLIYAHPLGIHAIQVVEKQTLSARLLAAWKNFNQLGIAIFEYFPIAFFPVLYIPISCAIKRQVKFNLRLAIIYLICFLFIIGVSLLVPAGTAGLIPGGKQWGPRFLLILIPIIALLAIKEWQVINLKARPPLKYASLAILSLLFVIGLHKNTYLGTLDLNKNHQGVLPAIQFLQKKPERIIAMSHQFVAQVLEPGLSRDKLFFRAEDSSKLVKLSQTLVENKTQTFLYVCYPFRDCNPPKDSPEKLKFSQGNQQYAIQLSNLGKFGRYPIYQASIVKSSLPKPNASPPPTKVPVKQ